MPATATPTSPDFATGGLQGHLELVCGLDDRGRSALIRQSFRAPMHISKPHEDAGALIVNIINPTAGLLAGDRIECSVQVNAGARLVLSTPSANRAHRMRSDRATVQQQYRVESDGSLENWPELLIPQAGAKYRQVTRIDAEQGAELFFWELLAPGRVASGEAFQFAELDWRTEVFVADRLCLRERYTISPQDHSVTAWQRAFASGYYASGIVLSPVLTASAPVWQRIHALHQSEVWIGCSPLPAGGTVIRILASSSITLRRTLRTVRELLYEAIGRPAPSLRRIG